MRATDQSPFLAQDGRIRLPRSSNSLPANSELDPPGQLTDRQLDLPRPMCNDDPAGRARGWRSRLSRPQPWRRDARHQERDRQAHPHHLRWLRAVRARDDAISDTSKVPESAQKFAEVLALADVHAENSIWVGHARCLWPKMAILYRSSSNKLTANCLPASVDLSQLRQGWQRKMNLQLPDEQAAEVRRRVVAGRRARMGVGTALRACGTLDSPIAKRSAVHGSPAASAASSAWAQPPLLPIRAIMAPTDIPMAAARTTAITGRTMATTVSATAIRATMVATAATVMVAAWATGATVSMEAETISPEGLATWAASAAEASAIWAASAAATWAASAAARTSTDLSR